MSPDFKEVCTLEDDAILQAGSTLDKRPEPPIV